MSGTTSYKYIRITLVISNRLTSNQQPLQLPHVFLMCNLNIFGQIFRILSGIILIAAAWYGPQTQILPLELMNLWKLGWLGIIPLVTGILAFCPIYAVFGIGHKPDKANTSNNSNSHKSNQGHTE